MKVEKQVKRTSKEILDNVYKERLKDTKRSLEYHKKGINECEEEIKVHEGVVKENNLV